VFRLHDREGKKRTSLIRAALGIILNIVTIRSVGFVRLIPGTPSGGRRIGIDREVDEGRVFRVGGSPAVLQLARQEVAISWVVMPIEAPICLFSYFFTDLILDGHRRGDKC
jgi:hypothetical protein